MKNLGAISGDVLSWPHRLLSADDLRRHLNGQRELVLLPRTIVTPLALDELRSRKIRISYEAVSNAKSNATSAWAYAQEKPESIVSAAVESLSREGISLHSMTLATLPIAGWSRALAESPAAGIVAFCSDPGLVCCIANKVSGRRAVAVLTPAQANRARQSVDANLLAIEMPGRTYFEIRQILRAVTTPSQATDDVTRTMKELDDAHR